MATVERRKGDRDGWAVRWRTLGGADRRRKCPDERTAHRLAAEIERLHAIGIDWQPPTVRDRTLIVDVARAYIDARRLRMRAETVRLDGTHLDVALRFLGERKVAHLDALTRPLLDDCLAWLLRPGAALHGKRRTPGSAGRTVGVLVALWQWAEDSGRYHDAPRAPRRVELPRDPDRPVVAPTWEEMDACLAALPERHQRLGLWLRLTGLRIGESLAVEWRDVDMARGTLTLRPETEKIPTGRTVPLHAALLEAMAGWGVREGRVLTGFGETNVSNVMREAWEAAGVREEVWRRRPDHAFRRGFKTGLLALGANPAAVDFLQAHGIGQARGRYIDGARLPLAETLALLPVPGAPRSNVVKLPHRRGA